MSTAMTRTVGLYLFVAYGLAWGLALGFRLFGGTWGSPASLAVASVIMWCPGIAALLVHRGINRRPIRRGLGLRIGTKRWLVLAWTLPVVLILLGLGVGWALPGVRVVPDPSTYLIQSGLSPSEVEAAMAALNDLPVPPLVAFVGAGLAAGATVNAVTALGEELGWRGLLLAELAPLGFWRASIVIGVVWGLWHAPVILLGHNFPEAPFAGIVVMTVATTVASPIYVYLTVRARSVLAAALFHGTFNGVGGITLLYLVGGSSLVRSPVGVVGIVAALLLVVAILIIDRHGTDDGITRSQPLPVWE